MTGTQTLRKLTTGPSFSISCSTPTSSSNKKWFGAVHMFLLLHICSSTPLHCTGLCVHKSRVLPSNPGGIIPINPRMFYTMGPKLRTLLPSKRRGWAIIIRWFSWHFTSAFQEFQNTCMRLFDNCYQCSHPYSWVRLTLSIVVGSRHCQRLLGPKPKFHFGR